MSEFNYTDERFADIQILRYKLKGFEDLSLKQKTLIYYLSQATLLGRDITTDQFGRYNLKIRKVLELIFLHYRGNKQDSFFQDLSVYLKRVWFSNGIHHHYGSDKFQPYFSENDFRKAVLSLPINLLPLEKDEKIEVFLDTICKVIFDNSYLQKRVNKADGVDIIQTSACNYYENVTQKEVETFYQDLAKEKGSTLPSWGLNSKLVKNGDTIKEVVWKKDGLYGNAISQIISWLERAKLVSENEQQAKVIDLLIQFYTTGDLKVFDTYSIEWLKDQESRIDFVNGFIEVYGDPLGIKASWEGIVEYKDLEATERTRLISSNAQWFEDHSPIDLRFKKTEVKGVTANVINAAMLGGDEYPSTAIGINLPNADWIRSEYGSKSVTIGNITDAYNKASHGNGFNEEFVIDEQHLSIINEYGDICDDLHTDLHECLGHGSGKLLPNTDPNALKAYADVIEEARADLFGLYYIADDKLLELELTPNKEAYKSQYYTYMMNGLITQLVRIKEGHNIEEAHMKNRALIAHWVLEHANGVVKLIKKDNKTFVEINDYEVLRNLFAELLAEIQRIKSEGYLESAKELVEKYAVKVDPELHKEVLQRYKKLNLAPYKGFVNPHLIPVYDVNGAITDIKVDYSETYTQQMLRYSEQYSTL